MRPVFDIGSHVLWLGSQTAANRTHTLRDCSILQRISALGSWGCPEDPSIRDMQPFRIDDVLNAWNLDDHESQMKEQLWNIGRAPKHGSLLVLCKQGCRRGAVLAGCYLMAKIRLDPLRVF